LSQRRNPDSFCSSETSDMDKIYDGTKWEGARGDMRRRQEGNRRDGS
jgi:hypothetical protein